MKNAPKGFKLQFSAAVKPSIYMIVLSCLYSVLYMLSARANFSSSVSLAAQTLLFGAYGLGLYFVCTMMWGKKPGVLSLGKTCLVLAWNLFWICMVNLISYAYTLVVNAGLSQWILLIVQLLAGLLIIFLVPATLLFYKALYEDAESSKEILGSIWVSLKKSPSAILNAWLILFIVLMVWDTLFSGPLSIYYGFNATLLMANLLYIGNPMFYWIMMLFVSGAQGAFVYMILLYILWGLLCTWLEMNLIAWIGSKWQPSKTE